MSQPARTSREVSCVGIDDEGITLRPAPAQEDFPVDVLLDDQRVVSFWLRRDTVERGGDLFYPWPTVLHRFLDGTTELSLVDHVNQAPFHADQVRLGSGEGPIRVQDAQGNPMGLDKSGRLTRLFATRSAENLAPLLDSIGTVLEAVEEAGLEPFLAYGTLLGAVRDGAFIGHDSDADLGYVSRHDHPVDVIGESFRLQRRLQDAGFTIRRYSGLAFKVSVRESDGSRRGLDVFGGFLREGHLFLMGEVGHPFRPEWLTPRTEATLAGRTFPVPARPERLLEVMYGPGWRVPDPAFKFATPTFAARRLNGWFRGTRVGLDQRWARFRAYPEAPPSGEPTPFARWVRGREPELVAGRGTLVDIGCGDGSDVLWFAGLGVHAHGLDHFPRGFKTADRRARREGLPVTFDWVNLTELRSVMVTGALLSREPGPRVVTARHVLDSTDRTGRTNLLRLARMLVRDSGRLHLEVRLRRLQGRPGAAPGPRRGAEPPGLVHLRELVAETGGIVEEEHLVAPGAEDDPEQDNRPPTLCRMVITWHRNA